MVDRLLFYVDETYGDESLKDYMCVLKYTLSGCSEPIYEMLPESTKESVQKENYIAYTLDVCSNFTRHVGAIKMCLIMMKMDENNQPLNILHSKESSIDITPVRPRQNAEDLERAIEILEGQVEKLSLNMATVNKTMPEDIVIDGDKIMLQNVIGSIGNGIELDDLGDELVDYNPEGLAKMLTD